MLKPFYMKLSLVPTDYREDTVHTLCTQLLNCVHRVNQQYFGTIYFGQKEKPSGSTELNWLRRAGAQGSRFFFQVIKNDTLTKPVDAGTCDEVICEHMEKNHSLCENPKPPPEFSQEGSPIQFSMDAFLRAIRANKKKAGQGLPPFVIKISDKFHEYFLGAINRWMQQGIPQFVLLANLWMLFKKGDRMDPGCFRPISIPHPL